jgi:quinoprotein dehydrogenase-associated probable ABC transporter substrate-binding protein
MAALNVARNGFIYLLDRTDGRLDFIDAVPYVYNNVYLGFEEDGRPIYDPDRIPGLGTVTEFCPSLWGGKDWPPAAYNPDTGMIYIPANENHCGAIEGLEVEYVPGSGYTGARTQFWITEGATHIGELQAWNVNTMERVWTVEFESHNWGPVLTTAGNLVFMGGTNDRYFRAFDAETGELLWEHRTNSGVTGVPSTFMVDGVQYIAVQSGWGVDAQRMQNRIAAVARLVGRRASRRARSGSTRCHQAGGTVTAGRERKARMKCASSPRGRPTAGLPAHTRRWSLLIVGSVLTLTMLSSAFADEAWDLVVCAESDNLPFSNEGGAGFENQIAELLAADLGARVVYEFLQLPTAVERRTRLQQGDCDILMGTVDGQEGYTTTLAYYRSSYVFVYRADRRIDITSFDDEALRELRIGVLMPDGRNVSPGTHALAMRGLIPNQVGFLVDYTVPDSIGRIVDAVVDGSIDVAVAWGPTVGHYVAAASEALVMRPVQPEFDAPFVPMVYSISIGLRSGEEEFRDLLDGALARRWEDVNLVLDEYNVPRLPLPRPTGSRR